MKRTLTLLALLAMTSAASAQTIATGNTVKAVNGPLLLQGVNSSGVPTQSVSISNVGHIDARSANFNGADGVTAQKITAGVIATTGGKVSINGANGNVLTTGVFNAGGKATMDAASGNITSLGTTDTNKLVVRNGAQITNGGLDMTNAKITRVATGTADSDAVNVGQLNNGLAEEAAAREAGDTANAAAIAAEATRATDAEAVLDARKADKTALTAEATARADADAALSARIDAEAAARATADAANANAATAQIAASEARSIKASRQSGALAMAVAGMTGASPTDHGRTAISMGVGTFGGETALAVGVSHAVTDAVRIFGSITQVSGGDTGAAIGGSYSF
jgi:hypothetical protein